MSEFKQTATLRTHALTEGKPVVRISGDGSREGSRIVWETCEAPGAVVKFVVSMDARSTQMAGGIFTCQTESGSMIDVEAWVRFGEHSPITSPSGRVPQLTE